ncbi:MAG: hypothetical protein OXD54_05650 [Candidatus Poribacteria bacterium]|nr:hypothetical protein [Candidatus Poribacteria bacterium]
MNFNFSGLNMPGLMNLGMVLVVSSWILFAIVHLTFASAVFKDAQLNRNRLFVLPGVWYIATLLGGVFVAAVYWIMHHSSLNTSNTKSQSDSDNSTIL